MKYVVLIIIIALIIAGAVLLNLTPPKSPPSVKKGVESEIIINRTPEEQSRTVNLPLKDKLDEIIIEHMEFDEVTIPAVIKALRVAAKQADPEKKGINIIWLPDNGTNQGFRLEEELEGDLLLDDDDEGDDDEAEMVEDVETMSGERTITIMFDDLSLCEAIRNICFAAELKYRIEEYAVVIADKDVALDNLQTRIYPVDSEADFGNIGGGGGAVSVVEYFKRRGVDFPNGAKIVYDDAISRIIATNTNEQLERIERIIEELNVVDPQVLVTARFVKIPDREFRKLKGTKAISLWDQVIRSDKTEIIASASMVTQNGEDGIIRMTREVYFPDSWGSCGYTSTSETKSEDNDSENSNEEVKEPEPEKEAPAPNGQILSVGSKPEFSEPSDFGVRLTVTPTVDPDKYTITLDMIPVLQYFAGWTNFDQGIKMGIIKAWTVTTQVTLYDGGTIPLGFSFEDVGNKSKRERNRFIALVTATLINPDGTPLRQKANTLNPIPKKRRREVNKKRIKGNSNKPPIFIDKIDCEDVDIVAFVDFLKKEKNISFALGIDEAELASIPRITLQLRDIPLVDLLRYLGLMTGLKYTKDGGLITIGYYSSGYMDVRFFKVRSAIVTRIAPSSGRYDEGYFSYEAQHDESVKAIKTFISKEGVYLPKGSNISYDPKTGRYIVDSSKSKFEDYPNPESLAATREVLIKYFEDRGVPFPPGATIAYSKRSGKLVVKNTLENLRRLETLLRELDIEQPQVMIEYTMLEISNKDLISLIGKDAALSDNFSEKQINRIINSHKSRILAFQSVIAKNGEESNIRLGNEPYFPVCWSSPEVVPLEGYISEISPVPEFGEAHDLGLGFTVTPNVSPDNYTITLNLNPQYLKFEGWSKFNNSYKIDTGKTIKTGNTVIKMPIVRRNDIIQSMKINDGNTIIAGRTQQIDISNKNNKSFNSNTSLTEMFNDARKNGQELKNVFFFIKANIMNHDGEFIRK